MLYDKMSHMHVWPQIWQEGGRLLEEATPGTKGQERRGQISLDNSQNGTPRHQETLYDPVCRLLIKIREEKAFLFI